MFSNVMGGPGFSRATIRQRSVVGPPVQALPQAPSNFASKPAQTFAPLSATRSLSWRVSPKRLKLAERRAIGGHQ
jgi:hypothetical protein